MSSLGKLFDNNNAWATSKVKDDPEFFKRLVGQQSPHYLWIGCADSRVPANEIVGLMPGELFVHRNIANVVVHTDLNCLAVLHFAVEILKVEHVIVCGHYGCSGIAQVIANTGSGISQHWLRHVEDVACKHSDRLNEIADPNDRTSYLCELNVIEQVRNVCRTKFVQEAWAHGQTLSVHGVVYGLGDGLLRNLDVTVSGADGISALSDCVLGMARGDATSKQEKELALSDLFLY
jgi:carbonic anhydrase